MVEVKADVIEQSFDAFAENEDGVARSGSAPVGAFALAATGKTRQGAAQRRERRQET